MKPLKPRNIFGLYAHYTAAFPAIEQTRFGDMLYMAVMRCDGKETRAVLFGLN